MPSLVPRTPRHWLGLIAGGFVVVAGGVVVLYLIAFRGSSQAPLALKPASPAASLAAGLDPSQLSGTWTIGSPSVAGYRVREKLGFLDSESDAVGRTSTITGSMTVTGTEQSINVPAASFTVDVSTLTSDRDMRDRRIHTQGLQSDTYPKATFELTEPVSIVRSAAQGSSVDMPITGRLIIHGTTKTVTIPVKAQFTGSEIEAVGSLTFPFSDYGMTPPSIGGFVTVHDDATMEFDLHLRRS